MIKVLHVFGRMNRGGAEMRTLELIPLLRDKGVRFDFCTVNLGEGTLDEKIRELQSEVFPCPLRPGAYSFGRRFLQLLRQSDYDIVHSHVHYFSGNIVRLAHKAGVPGRIVHFRNTFDGQPDNFTRRLYRKTMRRMADKHATMILAVCRGAMEFGWGKDWQKDPRTKVIYNGLDLTPFRTNGYERESLLQELGLSDKHRLIIHVGRFHRQKAHDVLLDAAAKTIAADPNFHFLLVGDGALRTQIEDRACTLAITDNVHFLGLRTDVPVLLRASDCFVLSSRWEGLPGVVLEALAAGLPVVATDLPGVREIAEHTELIKIIPLNDSNALAGQIIKTFKTIHARPRVERALPGEFNLQNCATKLFEVYK